MKFGLHVDYYVESVAAWTYMFAHVLKSKYFSVFPAYGVYSFLSSVVRVFFLLLQNPM